jgi:hypothetical protein
VFLLLACVSIDKLELSDDTAAPAPDTEVERLPDTGPPDDEPDDEPDDDALPGACAPLYDPDTVPTFELTFAREEWDGLRRDCVDGVQSYRPVTFAWNGESVAAMARLKGNWSWNCDKMQFVVSFNEEDPDARFHGLRKVMLDAPWYDHSLLHERLGFALFQARGLPWSCANSARLVVNGSYHGLYTNIERIDREYLERHFEDPDGNLYQGGSELKTNEDVGDISDLTALQAAVTVDEIAALVDLDQAVAEWSMEAMMPALDNYWAGVEINYYLYDDPARGFVYLPYDLDISFGDSAYPGSGVFTTEAHTFDPILYEHTGWLKEAVVKTVLSDPYWCDRFVDELAVSREVYDPDTLVGLVDAWSAQIADAVDEDERKAFSDAEHAAAIDNLRGFFADRAAYVDGWLAEGGHCPARF